jgi:hypothetical protein
MPFRDTTLAAATALLTSAAATCRAQSATLLLGSPQHSRWAPPRGECQQATPPHGSAGRSCAHSHNYNNRPAKRCALALAYHCRIDDSTLATHPCSAVLRECHHPAKGAHSPAHCRHPHNLLDDTSTAVQEDLHACTPLHNAWACTCCCCQPAHRAGSQDPLTQRWEPWEGLHLWPGSCLEPCKGSTSADARQCSSAHVNTESMRKHPAHALQVAQCGRTTPSTCCPHQGCMCRTPAPSPITPCQAMGRCEWQYSLGHRAHYASRACLRPTNRCRCADPPQSGESSHTTGAASSSCHAGQGTTHGSKVHPCTQRPTGRPALLGPTMVRCPCL